MRWRQSVLALQLGACGGGAAHATSGESGGSGGADSGSASASGAVDSDDGTGDGDGGSGSGSGSDSSGDGDSGGEPTVCGDGNLELGEDCDDGNVLDGDGCEEDCTYSTPAKKVVTGFEHTCVLFNSGQVKCWGHNDSGQLGYAHTQDIGQLETPDQLGFVQIGGIAVDIVAGGDTTCVLFDDAGVGCWGNGVAGGLGYANTENIGDDETPESAGRVYVGGLVASLAGGNGRMCAVLTDQSLRCWGYNNMGQLGYGHTDYIGDDETPASAGPVPLGGSVLDIAAGVYHTCAKLDDGGVRCWGQNAHGELGQGNTDYIGDDEPASVVPAIDLGGVVVADLACGGYHCCALGDAGEVACWGWNEHGQLGYGHTQSIGDDELPALAGFVDVGGPVLELGGEWQATCARLDEGIKCWGSNGWGMVGYGVFDLIALGDDELPSSYGLVEVGDEISGLTDGLAMHICGVTPTSQLRCWGSNTNGQLGYGIMEYAVGDNEVPATLPTVPFD